MSGVRSEDITASLDSVAKLVNHLHDQQKEQEMNSPGLERSHKTFFDHRIGSLDQIKVKFESLERSRFVPDHNSGSQQVKVGVASWTSSGMSGSTANQTTDPQIVANTEEIEDVVG